MDDIKESRPSRHTRADAPVNSQRLRQRAQGLYRSAPDGVLELKGEMDACLIPNPEALSIDSHLLLKI